MNWVKIANGVYKSECGRFTITANMRRGEYNLSDRDARDVCCPQYNRMQTVYSIQHGKNVAARWNRGSV